MFLISHCTKDVRLLIITELIIFTNLHAVSLGLLACYLAFSIPCFFLFFIHLFINSFYVISHAVCNSGRLLDLVVVLNFQNFDVTGLPDLQTFMRTLFGRFDLSGDSTRVGIVTQKGPQPYPAWYLNSRQGGFTVDISLAVG